MFISLLGLKSKVYMSYGKALYELYLSSNVCGQY